MEDVATRAHFMMLTWMCRHRQQGRHANAYGREELARAAIDTASTHGLASTSSTLKRGEDTHPRRQRYFGYGAGRHEPANANMREST